MENRLISVNELSETLGVNQSWIYSRTRLKGTGQIPHIRVGKYVRFNLDNVMEWLDQERDPA